MLILRDVLGYRASEIGYILEITEDTVTSALKRARATLRGLGQQRDSASRRRLSGSPAERRTVERFVRAFVAHDVLGIVALLSEDAWVKMPPMPFEYQGRDAAARFFTAMSPPRARTLCVVYSRANFSRRLPRTPPIQPRGVWRSVGIIVLDPHR